MTHTASNGTDVEGPQPGCWCCGDRTVEASLLRLESRPEVGVCFRCVDQLRDRKRAVQRTTRRAPAGPWWRRLQFRVGLNSC